MDALISLIRTATAIFAKGRISQNDKAIKQLDQRLDALEVKVSTDCIKKQDSAAAIERIDSYMVRIESKIDHIIND
ncbi:hypothetical protein OMCYN_01643 [cyanobiont of Ornithocercus magnificus]|nr:hypothetical protein OMCYN_01643 [cyanobiont of Ornithocercus magnificus]